MFKTVIKSIKLISAALIILSTTLLSGCKLAMMDPAGIIAKAEKHLIIDALILMLLIVIPVMILTCIIIYKYRGSNQKAEYKPHWGHSNILELICWTVPCVIIVILATMTWISSHQLNPYRAVTIKGKEPLTVQAVALDWKWLFIYPKQHVAAINYMPIPVNTPVRIEITADAPMNSLQIPRLAGQIYAMAAMKTRLYITADKPGSYNGFSANYSGNGFAGMTFTVKAGTEKQFEENIHRMAQASNHLDFATFNNKLVKPSSYNKVEYFSHVSSDLFHDILMKYMMPHKNKHHA